MKICGIEEAGRGPVMGPMVMAGCTIDAGKVAKLQAIGVKDSKLLTPIQREDMFEKIKEVVDSYEILVLSVADVDAALMSDSLNLNWLEAETSATLINALQPDKAILDCPSPNLKAYADYVRERLTKPVELVAEHKADVNYPIVSAASILAKVTRDREIAKMRKEVGVDFGSGYQTDPKTIKFLQENWDKHPKLFRKTWASYKKVVLASKQKGLEDF